MFSFDWILSRTIGRIPVKYAREMAGFNDSFLKSEFKNPDIAGILILEPVRGQEHHIHQL